MDTNTKEMNFPGLDRLEKRLPAFVKWLREGWNDARPLDVRHSGKFDWLVDNGTPMVDAYDATGGDIADPRHAIWCVLGVGTGKALIELIEKAGNHVVRILVIEEDRSIWKNALETSPLAQYIVVSKVFPVWDLAKMDIAAKAAISNPIVLGAVKQTLFLCHRGQYEGASERAKNVVREYTDSILQLHSALGNSAEDTMIGFNQIIRNYPNLLRSYTLADLAGKFAGRAAIIVSAGPSLEKNVHLLRDVQDKCIIIAVDTILRKLLGLGIQPHFVVALERVRETYDVHFADLPGEPVGVVPVISSVCVPEICGTWDGPFILAFKTLPLDVWFAEELGLSILKAGNSCAHMGIPLALLLGCRNVALIGQDLSFAAGGKAHASGTGWDQKGGEREQIYKRAYFSETFEAEGQLGEKVQTTPVWFSFKRVFEEFILDSPALTVYNATEGGILIKGARTTTLDQFLEEFVQSMSPMECRPSDLLQRVPLSFEDAVNAFREKLDPVVESLDLYFIILNRLSESVGRLLAAGMSLNYRRKVCFAIAGILDELISSSPIMSFILQAHVAVCAQILNDGKNASETDDFRKIESELREFEAVARSTAESARSLLDLLRRYMDEEPKHRIIIEDVGAPEQGMLTTEQALDAWRQAMSGDLPLFALTLLARFDFLHGTWPQRELLALARRALALGLIERGRRFLSSLLQSEMVAKDADFWNDVGISYCAYEFGLEPDFESSRRAFVRAMSLDPNNEERSRNYLAMQYILQSRAEAAYRLAPPKVRRNAAAALGDSWLSIGKKAKALEWFKRALDLCDESVEDAPLASALQTRISLCTEIKDGVPESRNNTSNSEDAIGGGRPAVKKQDA